MSLLSIIIVNYNSEELIINCLDSLEKYVHGIPLEIIVTDNASSDKEGFKIKSHHPYVKWIQIGYNSGFARANNAGMKAASGDMLLLLNPDTLSLDNSIVECYNRIKSSGFVAAGVQLLNNDGSPQTSGSYFVKGGLNHLLPIPYWGNFIRWAAYKLNHKVPGIKKAGTEETVDWINGAFIMVKPWAAIQSGYFDEDFFLYSEEIEWCSRLQKLGPLGIYGDLKMIHLQGETVSHSIQSKEKGYDNILGKTGYQLTASHLLRIRKQYGVAWLVFILLNFIWAIPVFFFCSFVEDLVRFKNPFRQWKAAWAFCILVKKLVGLSPLIISGKPHFYKFM